MYVLANGDSIAYPYGPNHLRDDNPQTSFPALMPDTALAEWGVFPVAAVPQPLGDHTTVVTEGQPKFIDGVWRQVWVVENATAELIAERTVERAASVRQERNAMLSSCDWTQVADAPVDSLAWAVYRQKLRELPGQVGFPWNVIWPSQPE